MRVLVTLGVATGARLGELLALRWQDVDLAAATVRLGWSRRIVKRRMQLKGPKTEAGYRTVRPMAARTGPDSVSGMFREFVDGQGLPKTVHVHTLRHSAASFLAAAGVPASDIAAQLGHKDGGALALRVYVHPMAEGLAKAGAHLDQVIGG